MSEIDTLKAKLSMCEALGNMLRMSGARKMVFLRKTMLVLERMMKDGLKDVRAVKLLDDLEKQFGRVQRGKAYERIRHKAARLAEPDNEDPIS